MPTEKKIELVEELRDRIERCEIAIATEYRGLKVNDMVDLHRTLREADEVELRVVKNRLFKIAAEAAKRPEMAALVEGPTAILFGFGDVAAPARAATEYMKTANNDFAMRAGVMGTQLLTAADLKELATLPPKPELIAKLAGTLQGPVANLAALFGKLMPHAPVRLLNDSVSTLAGLLDARAEQLEGA
jgi:large subunit ribosomal protein L10